MTETPIHWRSISPRYKVQALAETAAIFLPFYFLSSFLAWAFFSGPSSVLLMPLGALSILFLFFLALIPRRFRSYGYLVRDDDLIFRHGIIFHRQVAVPYGRLQLVAISRGPVSRILGLCELRLVTAAESTGVRIPGLTEEAATELRDQLIKLAESRRAGL